MSSPTPLNRPALTEALDAWKQLLAARGFATELRWIFEENLCFEKSRADKDGYHLGFQTRFTPPPEDALDIAFDHFCETDKRMFFTGLAMPPGNPFAFCCPTRGLKPKAKPTVFCAATNGGCRSTPAKRMRLRKSPTWAGGCAGSNMAAPFTIWTFP